MLQALKLALEDVLFPDKNLVEFTVSDNDLIKFAEILRISVHDTEDPESVILDRLNGVTVEGQRLQVLETVELFGLI